MTFLGTFSENTKNKLRNILFSILFLSTLFLSILTLLKQLHIDLADNQWGYSNKLTSNFFTVFCPLFSGVHVTWTTLFFERQSKESNSAKIRIKGEESTLQG